MRRAVFASAALALALALAALAGELVARAAGLAPQAPPTTDDPWSEPHPVLGWRNREGVARSNEAGAVAMTFWSGGRRASRAAPAPLAPPRRRVALVGGSWMQGYGVVDEETAGFRLQSARPEWLVENFGTGGYGTLQAQLSAELAVDEGRLAPDVVVYGFATFHAMRNVATHAWLAGLRARSGDRLAPPRAEIDGPRLVVHAPVLALPAWPLERRSALVAAIHERASERALRERDAWAEPVTLRLLRTFPAAMRARSARAIVAILHGSEEEGLGRYAAAAARGGAAVVDCRYPGDGAQPHLRVGGTGHPNGIVHAHWARCIEAAIDALAAPRPGAGR